VAPGDTLAVGDFHIAGIAIQKQSVFNKTSLAFHRAVELIAGVITV
jgi:hypothetical protein